jgi:hypothetical protein
VDIDVWPSALNVLVPPSASRSLFVDSAGAALPKV